MCVCVFLIEIHTTGPIDLKFCMEAPFSPALVIGYVKFDKAKKKGQDEPEPLEMNIWPFITTCLIFFLKFTNISYKNFKIHMYI